MIIATIRYRDAERRARTGESLILPRSDTATDVIADSPPARGTACSSRRRWRVRQPRLAGIRLTVRNLVITGVLTDACVDSSARHAAERGFQVIVVDDACAAWEEAFHVESLRNLSRYFARIAATEEVVAGLERAGGRGGGSHGGRT